MDATFAFLRRLGGTMLDQICIWELAGKSQHCYNIAAHPSNLVWWRDGKELLYTTPEAILARRSRPNDERKAR